MGWNKDGSTIRGRYLDEYDFTGVVTESRVSYGGKVLYTVSVDEPIVLPFASETRSVVIINENQLVADFGVIA